MHEVGLGERPRFGPYPTFGLGAPPESFALSAPPPVRFLGDILRPGQSLRPYDGLKSKNGRVHVILQPDGNCVLYGDGQPLWWTGVRPGVNQAAMQGDGNFVLYKPGEGAVWASDTAGHPGGYLFAQDDANLVLYWGVGGSVLWSSETSGFRYYGGPGKPITIDDILEVAGDVVAVAQVVISFVPGVGAGINAAIAAGAALAKGENITDAVIDAAENALPGGPVAATAFKAAVAAGKAIARGESVSEAALAATREALPSDEAKKAFDVGLAVIHGQNVQQALVEVTKSLAPDVAQAASELFKQPDLMKLPIAQVAGILHTSPATVSAATTALNSNKVLAPPATEKRAPPALKAAPPIEPDPKLVSNLAAVARAKPQAKDEEVAYVAVLGNDKLSANANRISPKLVSNMIAVARAFPHAKDEEVLYIAALPPSKRKPPELKAAPMKTTTTKPSGPTSAIAYAPYPKNAHSGAVSAPPPGHRPPHPTSFRGGRGGPGRWDGPWGGTTVVSVQSATCRTWSDPITIPQEMQVSAKIAVGASQGRPTTMRGDNGVLYLFSLENGMLVGRACTSFG